MNTYYAANLLIFAGVDIIACIALNLQFGVSGIVNFAFIVFQAAGAYAAAVLSMPPDTSPDYSFQIYLGGYQLPFPLPWIGGAIAGGLLAVPVGLVVLRKLRNDYQAIALLVTSIIANTVINNARPWLNGAAGLALVPQPLQDQIDPSTDNYFYFYIALTAICVGLVWFAAARIVNSPFGRTLRAMRDQELAATALGKNPMALKLTMFVVGGVIAGLSGAILVGFLTVWAPSTWLYPETIILFAAVIVGGRGNNLGAIVGALLVPVGFEEVTRLLVRLNIGPPNFIPAMEWVCIGLFILGFLWFRPEGVRPERRNVFPQGFESGRGSLATATESRPMLVATEVHRHFEGMHAVDGVSLEVPRGEITGLIGPNGAGKSTFMAVVAGTMPATGGRIVFDGEDVTRLPAYRRARRGLVRTFQLPSEFARLTVLENLLVAAPDHRGDSLLGALLGPRYWMQDERRIVGEARALLKRFGMSAKESDYAGNMSGGQKRLIEIMRALMLHPRCLLLDEPMSGVHPRVVEEIRGYLLDLRRDGLTILMVEHELHLVEQLCDSVFVMAQGKLIGSGTMASLRRQREIVDAYLVG